MIRRRFLMGLLGAMVSLACFQVAGRQTSLTHSVIPLGSRARTLVRQQGFPLHGGAGSTYSTLLLGCLGGRTGLDDARRYKCATTNTSPAFAVVLMPMYFEGKRRYDTAIATINELRAGDVEVEIVKVLLTPEMTLDEARRVRERALTSRANSILTGPGWLARLG